MLLKFPHGLLGDGAEVSINDDAQTGTCQGLLYLADYLAA
jgi:hypothetical protein